MFDAEFKFHVIKELIPYFLFEISLQSIIVLDHTVEPDLIFTSQGTNLIYADAIDNFYENH